MAVATTPESAVTSSVSLCCPICKSALAADSDQLCCTSIVCRAVFPVIDGVPVLINEARSVFSISDFTCRHETTTRSLPPVVRFAMGILPEIDHNLKAEQNYVRLARLLRQGNSTPQVLVVGGGALGKGMKALLTQDSIELTETDVYFGNRTRIICDAHDLPFEAGTFDGVIIQAVLEHVVDPFRCVEEIYRVLKPDGLVYAETPFMQQVHLGPYDFMRFTHLGHRRLFRRFEEINSGALAGPGSVLAWACEYFLLSFTRSQIARIMVRGFSRLALFWLKYADYYLIDKPGTFDNASGHYFLGRKSARTMSDRELVTGYRGAIKWMATP
jgi:SAM-dependent methyltransferase